MSITMYQASVPRLVKILGNLSGILGKAQQHVAAGRMEMSALMNARLHPDMFPFVKQVHIACDKSRSVVALLAGVEMPVYEDTEQTLEELQVRIAKSIAFIETIAPEQINGTEDHDIELKVSREKTTYKGLQLLFGHSMPNVYFHMTTAYNILRHNGVDIGKRDYLGNP